jgi:hypothetical protein
MKIIEQGGVKEWSIQVRCTGKGNQQEHHACNSLLEVGYGDLFRTENHVRDDVTYYVTIRCISCGTLTDIPDKDVPYEIRMGLPTKSSPTYMDFRYRDQDRMRRRK